MDLPKAIYVSSLPRVTHMDKVELEPIPSGFLPPLNTDPLFATMTNMHGNVERVRRVCGYREIFMKRMHIEYLKDKEKEDVCHILYPEKVAQEVDSMFIETDGPVEVLHRRFRYLAPGGGSNKKKKKHKHKHSSVKKLKRRKLSQSYSPSPTMKLAKKRAKSSHESRHDHHDRVKTYERKRNRSLEYRRSHSRRRSRKVELDVRHEGLGHHHKRRKENGEYRRRRTQSGSHIRKTRRNDSEEKAVLRSKSHHHHHRHQRNESKSKKRHKSYSKENGNKNVSRSRKDATSKKMGKSLTKERKKPVINPSQGYDKNIKNELLHKKKVDKTDHTSSKQRSKIVNVIPPKNETKQQLGTHLGKEKASQNLKRTNKSKNDQKPVDTSLEKKQHLQSASKKIITKIPKNSSRDENNNAFDHGKKGLPATSLEENSKRKSVKIVKEHTILGSGESNSIPFQEATPVKSNLKKLAEATQVKLQDWVNHGNRHRVRPSEPDENANYLINDDNLETVVMQVMQHNIVEPMEKERHKPKIQPKHVSVTMQDEQTPSRIAQQFRDTTVAVFTAGVSTDHKGHNPHSHQDSRKSMKGNKTHASKTPIATKGKVKDAHKPDPNKAPETQPLPMAPPVFDITNFDSYFKYVYGVPIAELPERDSEWLELSVTDEDELDEEIQSFEKENPKWMIDGISFESQQLITELKLMYWTCLLTGRQFYYNIPNFLKGHMEFATKRVRMIPFFISTFILWASLVIMAQSYVSITFEEQNSNDTNSGTAQVQIEQLEANKYGETSLYVIANLAFVAVWSVFVILRDGQLITHYFNCWCPALAEMETSAAVKIETMTQYNLLAWLISGGIIVIGFSIDFPANVRGTTGLLAILMFRNVFPDIRLQDDNKLFWFQIFGLVFILYILFCARMLFTLMQIVALIARNSAEMWNFKFALTFNQLVMTNRGHMKRISLQLPLIKFFTHHRIMTALVRIYGEIFGVPIMIYLIVEVGMMTYVMVRLFNFKAGNVQDYNGKPEVIYEYFQKAKQNSTIIHIKFYHSPVEEISTSLFILIMICFDYMFTTEVIASASQAFCDGFEFVRRTNLVLCKTSHQRRLVQSLLWSMSDTDPTLLSAANYFPICRSTIVAGLGAAVAFFSLIIQLQSETKIFFLEFKLCEESKKLGGVIIEPRCKPK
ncbi:uncharacterized protein LOC110846779 isoform X2 [Folsomia candida]|uniref:uncharacterized protein LOC110846779 isoform X2 n=1 Tax=Folsomia candida TaxID=158441 RepID=UPI001604D11E|nr:uncharacterized protein LOC110846779 isoform X2 [Folsomia candida]